MNAAWLFLCGAAIVAQSVSKSQPGEGAASKTDLMRRHDFGQVRDDNGLKMKACLVQAF